MSTPTPVTNEDAANVLDLIAQEIEKAKQIGAREALLELQGYLLDTFKLYGGNQHPENSAIRIGLSLAIGAVTERTIIK